MPSTLGWSLSHWIFLLLTAAAGVALTWFALKKFFAESLLENEQLSQQVSQLRQQMAKSSAPAPVARGLPRDVDFVPSSVMPSPEEKTAASASGSGEDLWVEAMGIAAAELADRDQEESGCKVGPLIRGAVEKLERRFAGLPIQVEISGVDGLRGPGEEMPMKTALEEVLKNAFEAVAESPEKKITVYGEKLDGFNRITIRDSGPGISPENLKKVFEPFFTTKESGGASRGLGLNVVRRVVEELQGRVQIFSEGQGARVEIELPHDVNKGLPHQPVAHDTEFGALDLDFDEIEKKFSKPLPSVNVRKPKVRTLN